MSKRSKKDHVPSDPNVMRRIQEEIARNTQEMTYNFWQEFELVRNIQRRRLSQEQEMRDRINGLVRTIDDESNQQAEDISRSISVNGMTTLGSAVSITATRPPAIYPAEDSEEIHRVITPEIRQQLRNSLLGTGPATSSHPVATRMQMAPQRRGSGNQRRRSKAAAKVETSVLPSPALSLNIPQAPPTSRATIVSAGNSRLPSNRTTPYMSKYQLAKKPKK
ncbi:uncharacterized protein Dwil_GK28314 [Drosophila willistoni]|uniref:Uncharacterized protein n=1 Tax=Drosophila willistoni TaxID=7260 RepID=A0A0Q9WRA0_DROWI|nr:uncharacterized protein LOC26530316 [Drosophila willistoni]KRF98656.1 uncharacterized protein Dwil_GK28314 [Drosophila willistoni]